MMTEEKSPPAAPPESPAPQPPAPQPPAPQPPAPRREGGQRKEGGARRESGRPASPGGGPGPRKGKRQYFRKRKVCRFCAERVEFIDYKKPEVLQGFVQERGKVLPRRLTGTCSRHQRWLITAIQRARNIALLPFGVEL